MTRDCSALRRLGAAAAALGLAVCLALPGVLCRAGIAAMERGTLARPVLDIVLDETGRDDPLALALFQARTLDDGGGRTLDLDQADIAAQLTAAVERLTAAGVLDEREYDLAAELLAAPERFAAERLADGTLEYDWQTWETGYQLRLVWHPDLEQPLILELDHAALPDADPAALRARWMAFLGEDEADSDWQYTDGMLQGVATAWSPARQLLLTVYAAPGRRAVRAYSVPVQDYPALLEEMAAQERLRREQEAWLQEAGEATP